MADYRKMWEDLGMDVDTHDQLCEVLPQAFGDVYLSQENRPESMDYYNFVVAEIHGVRPAELIEHQKKGGKVFGTFCVYVPDEIVFAADAIATGLCGGFTTFSTFSYESMNLLRQGYYMIFIAYISASISLGIVATLAGGWIGK